MAAFRDLHGGSKTSQPATDNRDFHSVTGHGG
jgi:hypothetical protein